MSARISRWATPAPRRRSRTGSCRPRPHRTCARSQARHRLRFGKPKGPRKAFDSGAVAHRERDLARGDQHTSGRIEPEGAQRDAATVDVPNQGRLAGRLVDRERRDAVLAARKYLPAFELHRGGGAVGKIERAAVGVYVDRPDALACRRLGVGERLLDEDGLTGEAGRRIAPVDVKLVLALDRHVDPGLRGVEVQMPRAEMHAVARLDRGKLRQYAILEGKRLERTGVHWIVAGRIVAARDQDHLLVVRRYPNLVGIFAGVEPIGLVHSCAERAVTVDEIDLEGDLS